MSTHSADRSRLAAALARTLATALILAPVASRATVVVTATRDPVPAPFANAVTADGVASQLTVSVRNSGTEVVHRVDFVVPTGYTAVASSSFDIWTASRPSNTDVRFVAACASAGIPVGGSVSFVFNLTTTARPAADATSPNFTVNARGRAGCQTSVTGTTTFTSPVKTLYLTGATSPASLLGPGLSGTVTWTITNRSSGTLSNVTASPVMVDPGTAAGSCTTIPSLASRASAVSTCTYTFSASGTYTFTANATSAAGNTTAVGATAGTIAVGSAGATWSRYVIAQGRPPYTLALTVSNTSGATVSRVDVVNPTPLNWALQTGTVISGALTYGGGSAADVLFNGPLAPNGNSSVTITFSGIPPVASTTSYTFHVTLTPTTGPALTVDQTVVVVVPIADVANPTIRSDASGQLLTWTNTGGAAHDGVVVFAAPAGTDPPTPTDLTAYTRGTGGVVYVDGGGSLAESYLDAPAGNVDYRVCNHDQYLVYSSCSSGFPSGKGWLSSGAVVGTGWVDALGGDTRVRPAFVPGGRVAQGSNAPYVAILDVASGQPSFTPAPIPGLPTTYTPVIPLANGTDTVIFAADQGGNVTAINASDGSLYWPAKTVSFPGENFTAGVAGITRSYASAAYQAAYSMDMLLLGSASGTGNVYAIDTSNGNVLWSFSAGASVTGLINYDAATDLFYVPTRGQGVKAYTIVGSRPGVPAPAAPSWVNPDPAGQYAFHCVRFLTSVACLDTSGVLRVMDKTTGALAIAAPYPTLITSGPSAPVLDSDTAAPGLVISSATDGVQVLTVNTTATPYTIASRGLWPTPTGVRISTPAVYTDAARRYLVVGGGTGATDGQRLYRISLDDVQQLARSPQVSAQAPPLTLAQPTFDSTTGRYLFGTSDGHVWAIPASTGWVTP